MIKCDNLVLGYNNQPITAKINLMIPDNKWIGIIGKNGTGKSTFLKSVLGNIPILEGELQIFGAKVGKYNKYISYIPQEREINLSDKMSGFSLVESSYEGWRLGVPFISRKISQRVAELIELVGATDYATRPFCTLSGGQKKRIYLAQALINQPKLILLDEPLADLDPHAKQHFIQALQKIHQTQHLGLLIISHDMHEIAEHLDSFLHFTNSQVHYCETIECVREDSYVGI
jgi:ABC-type Mn2+/Zn2+ transport system ATPase subunit